MYCTPKRFFGQAKQSWIPTGIESAFTPSNDIYMSNDLFLKEKENIFKKYPQYIVNKQYFINKDIGTYVSGLFLDEPYMLIKNEDNNIESFYNVCRHHGSELIINNQNQYIMTGKLDSKCIKCPYHGWEYNFNGQLTKATKLKGIQNFKNKDYGLHKINQFNMLNDFIFIQFDDSKNAANIFNNNADIINDEMIKHDFNNDNLVHVYSRLYKVNCNWKIFVENYLDGGYHVPILHTGLSSNLDYSKYNITVHDHLSIQSCKSGSSSNDTSNHVDFIDRIGENQLYIYQYPNIMWNRYGKWLDINHVIPMTTSSCMILFDYFIEKDIDKSKELNTQTSDEVSLDLNSLYNGIHFNMDIFTEDDKSFINDSLVASNQVQMEDILISESVQRGVTSTSYGKNKGRYVPGLETPMYQFHLQYFNDI